MKRAYGLMMALALGTSVTFLAAAEKQVNLRGVVTDSACGAKHMMSGDDAKCVRMCVKGGGHYALVSGGKVYALLGHDEELGKLAGESVSVSGTVNTEGAIQLASVAASANSAAAQTSPSQPNDPPTVAVEGLVRDIACPIQNKQASARTFNIKCAVDCVRKGSPIVIQTDDGLLYTPISSSMPDEDVRPRLLPFVGKYVRVQGQVFERQGSRAIMVQDITELKDVHLTTNAE
jgi:hypothetical protein